MKVNRKCNYCGKDYYCCLSCIAKNSWKNVCCSVECFNKLTGRVRPQELKDGDLMSTLLRAELTNHKTISIVGYDIELGRFDCTDGVTRTFEDFICFYIPSSELKEIKEFYESKVKEAGRAKVSARQTKKKETSEEVATAPVEGEQTTEPSVESPTEVSVESTVNEFTESTVNKFTESTVNKFTDLNE
jgi:hypothetical protein